MPSKPTPQTWETAKQAIKSYQQEVLRPNLRQYTLLHNKAPEPDYLAYVRQAIDELIPLFARMGRAVQAIRPAILMKQREKLRNLITACGPRFAIHNPGRPIVDGDAVRRLEHYMADLAVNLASDSPKQKAARRAIRWPKERTERAVERYLNDHKREYNELVPRVLSDEKKARRQFLERFGQMAIAKAIGSGCKRQNVEQTDTFKNRVAPLLKKPPQRPKGWKPPEPDQSQTAATIEKMRRQAGR